MKDLAADGELSGVVSLYDIDRDAAEKNAVSHRGHALRALSEHVAAVLTRG